MTRDPVPPVVPHRGGTGPRGWQADKRTKCLRCGGRRGYVSAITKAQVVCPVCNGSGREPGRY